MNTDRMRSPAMVLACASLILCLGFGIRSSFGLFLQPMSLDNGWGRETFSIAMAFQNLLWGVLAPLAGGIGDRWGNGRVIAGCGAAYVIGLVVMAFAETPFTLHLGSGFFIGLALSGTTFATVLAVIARVAPPEQRSMMMGVATSAGSFGQFALVPLAQFLIGAFDWQHALLGLAAIALLMVPLAAALRGAPAAVPPGGQSLGAALSDAWRERGFHLLFWGYFVCGFHIAMLTVHLPAFVTDAGLTPRHGMTAIALIGLFNVVGSFASGMLGGRFSKKHLLACIYLLRSISLGLLLVFPLTEGLLYVFAASIGLLWLSTVPLTNGLVVQIFGMRYAATLSGVVFFGHQIGSFVGVWLAGYLFDATGTYTGALAISVGLGVFAALVNLPVNEQPLTERKLAAMPA